MGEFIKPSELTDEDTWLGLTKIKFLYVLLGLAIMFSLFKILAPLEMFILLGVIYAFVIEVVVALVKLPIPEDKYLFGGGYPTDVIIFRILRNKLKRKKICVKNLEDSRNDFISRD